MISGDKKRRAPYATLAANFRTDFSLALRSPNRPAQIDLIGPRHRTGRAANGRANQYARRPSEKTNSGSDSRA